MKQTIRGTKDIFSPEIDLWVLLEQIARTTFTQFNYKEIRTPLLEYTEVFQRAIGEGTDVVGKEMYTFLDRGDTSITLRPEFTAGVIRSVIQHDFLNKHLQKLFYFGPIFRYERPQKGRQRQFHQVGVECIGYDTLKSDVEIVVLTDVFLKAIGITTHKFKINTLGSKETRASFSASLVQYLESKKSELSEDSQRRLSTNPLRILDSKSPQDKLALENAPKLHEFLSEDEISRFEAIQNSLASLSIDFEVSHNLVRGLDYYSHFVFEITGSKLGSQDSLGGGGRYNNMFEEFGAKPTPCIGVSLGMERLILELEGQSAQIQKPTSVYILIANQEYYTIALQLQSTLITSTNCSVYFDLAEKSFKNQMKDANNNEADFVLILGEDEIANNSVSIKNMSTSEQSTIQMSEVSTFFS